MAVEANWADNENGIPSPNLSRWERNFIKKYFSDSPRLKRFFWRRSEGYVDLRRSEIALALDLLRQLTDRRFIEATPVDSGDDTFRPLLAGLFSDIDRRLFAERDEQ